MHDSVIALRVTRRPGATEPDPTAIALPPEGLVIGRADDCGLLLADPLRVVSRQHAQVTGNGQAARVRCVSSSTPMWVNDVQLDPGGERALLVGDRLRIGRFELAVEPAAATEVRRSRLDRWFDLDGAPDPLAAESPLHAVEAAAEPSAAASEAVTAGPAADGPVATAVVSWQTRRHVVRTGAPAAADAPSVAAAAPVQAPVAQEGRRPAPAVFTPPQSAPAPKPARRPARGSPEPAELAAAFARGARLGAEAAPTLTPEWMEHVGALLRETAEGTLALLQSRAVAKRHMRAEGTHIAPRQNNPLKFSPDANEALTRMLQRDGGAGFLDPVAALRDAHHDLLVHQVAMVAGMRAAVFELFSRLGPAATENAEGAPHGTSRLPILRAAALWKRHCMQHAQLLEHLDDDFEAIFGREFLRAYEAQSRVADPDARPTPSEGRWPNGR